MAASGIAMARHAPAAGQPYRLTPGMSQRIINHRFTAECVASFLL
jgi:hypothetical protein